jgi:hypothetical protein
MTLCDAIQLAVWRTGHQRFEWLCSEQNPDPESRAGYRALVLQLAAGEPLAQPRSRPVSPSPARPCGCQGSP